MRWSSLVGLVCMGWALACGSGVSVDHMALADAAFEAEAYPEAIDHLSAVIDADPEHAEAWMKRAVSRYFQGDYPAALKDIERAEALDPNLPNLQTYKQMIERKLK